MGKRSAEALLRRAAKRNRTLEEQKLADGRRKLESPTDDDKKKTKTTRETKSQQEVSKSSLAVSMLEAAPVAVTAEAAAAAAEVSKILNEEGAWKCPSCHNNNFASRFRCHSKTCNERRPDGKRPARVITSQRLGRSLPKLSWPSQAGPERVAYNIELRKRYKESKDLLTEEEVSRAEILLARDERKRHKKEVQAVQKAVKLQKKAKAQVVLLARKPSVETNTTAEATDRHEEKIKSKKKKENNKEGKERNGKVDAESTASIEADSISEKKHKQKKEKVKREKTQDSETGHAMTETAKKKKKKKKEKNQKNENADSGGKHDAGKSEKHKKRKHKKTKESS